MSTCTLEYEFPPQQFQLSARRKLTFSPSEPLADVKLRIAKEIGLPEAIVPLLSCKEYNPMVALRDNASLLAALKYDFSRNARTDSHHRDVNLVLYKNADGTSQLIAPAFEDTNIEAASGEAALAADAFWRTGTRLGVSFSKTPPTEALVEVRTTGLDSSDPDLQASVIVLGLTDDSTVTDLQAKLATATSVPVADQELTVCWLRIDNASTTKLGELAAFRVGSDAICLRDTRKPTASHFTPPKTLSAHIEETRAREQSSGGSSGPGPRACRG